MADDHHPHGPLGDALKAQLAAVHRLQTLLEEEYRLLGESDPEPLSRLTHAKAEAAETLARLAAEAERHLAETGLPPGRAGWQLWLQSLPETARRRGEDLWAALVDGLESLQRQNEVNGRALELRRQTTETLLDALRGQSRDTYGPRRSGGSGQALAKA